MFFASITKFMNRLRYPQKFMLIGTLLFVPVSASGYMFISNANDNLQFASKERQGLAYHRMLMQLNEQLLHRRTLFMSSDPSTIKQYEPAIRQELETTSKQLDRLQQTSKRLLPSLDAWTPIRIKLEQLLAMDPNTDRALVYALHSRIMTDNGYFMFKIANLTGLRNDDHNGTNQLSGVIMNQFPLTLSQLDSLIGMAIYRVTMGTINGEEQTRMEILNGLNHDLLGDIVADVERGLPFITTQNETTRVKRQIDQWQTEMDDYARLLQHALGGTQAEEPSIALITDGNDTALTGYALYHTLTDRIDGMIAKRETALERTRTLTVGLLIVLIGVIVTLFLAVSLSVMRSVRALQATSLQIAEGNLNARVRVDSQDELKSVEIAFNETIRVFGELLQEKSALETQIWQQAHYDSLTGLPNRFLFYEKLHAAVQHASGRRRDGQQAAIALLYIDLDGFKPVNDIHGHHVGDALLIEFAKRLRGCEPEQDTSARIGGDEFTLFIPRLAQEADARLLVERVMAELTREFHIAGHTIRISGSIGTSLYPRDGEDAVKLVQHADQAMYAAKHIHRERIVRSR